MAHEKEHYFLTYSGAGLPLKLVSELDADAIRNRNTYFSAIYDESGRIAVCRKIVYGEVEFEHRYAYDEKGALTCAEITEEEETRTIQF
jgi:hypothetical protein